MGIFDDALDLAKDPFNTNKIKQQQDGLQSGIGTKKKFWEASAGTFNGQADNTLAQLTRDQWADYINTYPKYENQLIGMAMGDADNLQSEQRAATSVENAFAGSLGTLSRDRQRQGVQVNTEQAMDEARQGATLKTAAMVGGINKARLHAQDRDTAILTGGLSSLNPIEERK